MIKKPPAHGARRAPQRTGREMLFNLFSAGKVDEFARSLAHEVARRYPPAIANDPEQIISQKRLATILEETFSSAHRFNQENRLGFFRKAKLGNTFQWTLREMGYDDKFIDMATRALLVSLTRQPAEGFAQADKPGALE
jgi:hypothetical protein